MAKTISAIRQHEHNVTRGRKCVGITIPDRMPTDYTQRGRKTTLRRSLIYLDAHGPPSGCKLEAPSQGRFGKRTTLQRAEKLDFVFIFVFVFGWRSASAPLHGCWVAQRFTAAIKGFFSLRLQPCRQEIRFQLSS
jgi:hypothetical protein